MTADLGADDFPSVAFALTAVEHQIAAAVLLMRELGYTPETITDLVDHVVTHGWSMAADT